MNRTASWLTFLVALIGTLVWARLGRRAQERPTLASVVETPAEAVPVPSVNAPVQATDEDTQEPARTEAESEPATFVRRFPVRVVTRVSHARDAAAVPGLAFEVFAQRSRVGAPATPSLGIPAPAHVPTDRVLHQGRTDETGTASFALDAAGLVLTEGGLP